MNNMLNQARTKLMELANTGSERIDALGDARQRKRLLGELGELGYAEAMGTEVDPSERDRIVAEITKLSETPLDDATEDDA